MFADIIHSGGRLSGISIDQRDYFLSYLCFSLCSGFVLLSETD